MEDKLYFTVDLDKEEHQKSFSVEQNGQTYEIVSHKVYKQMLAEKEVITSSDTIKYAAKKGYIDFLAFDKDMLIILSPKTLSWKPKENYSQIGNKLDKMEIKTIPLEIKGIVLKNGTKLLAKKANNEAFFETTKEKHYVLMRGDKKIAIKFKRDVESIIYN